MNFKFFSSLWDFVPQSCLYNRSYCRGKVKTVSSLAQIFYSSFYEVEFSCECIRINRGVVWYPFASWYLAQDKTPAPLPFFSGRTLSVVCNSSPWQWIWSYFLNICEVKAFVFLDRYGEPEKRNFCGIVLRFYIPATEDNRPFNISQMALFCNILSSRGTKKKQWKASNHRALLLQTPIFSWRYLNYLKSLINRCLNHILNLRGLLRKSRAARSSRIS